MRGDHSANLTLKSAIFRKTRQKFPPSGIQIKTIPPTRSVKHYWKALSNNLSGHTEAAVAFSDDDGSNSRIALQHKMSMMRSSA